MLYASASRTRGRVLVLLYADARNSCQQHHSSHFHTLLNREGNFSRETASCTPKTISPRLHDNMLPIQGRASHIPPPLVYLPTTFRVPFARLSPLSFPHIAICQHHSPTHQHRLHLVCCYPPPPPGTALVVPRLRLDVRLLRVLQRTPWVAFHRDQTGKRGTRTPTTATTFRTSFLRILAPRLAAFYLVAVAVAFSFSCRWGKR